MYGLSRLGGLSFDKINVIIACCEDETETQVLSYGLKHSVTPKQIPTEAIVSSVEAVLSRQHELSESTKDNIRSRVTSTLQSASLPNSNLTTDEQRALKTTENRPEHSHTARRQRTSDCCYGQDKLQRQNGLAC